ncbi:MAG: multiprotein-bridging factor 1 family protein [Vicinamibacterales bacterium]
MTFGDMVRAARTGRGWTLADLAQQLGVSESVLSRWETGASPPPRDPEVVNRIVRELGLSAEEALRALGYRLYPPAAASLPTELIERLLDLGESERQALLPIVRAMARVRMEIPR